MAILKQLRTNHFLNAGLVGLLEVTRVYLDARNHKVDQLHISVKWIQYIATAYKRLLPD